ALPDPRLRFGIDNLPVTGAEAWRYNVDPMTMWRIGVMQEVPNAEKRDRRTARAAAERQLEQASLAAERAKLRRDVAVAWFEYFHAEQSRQVLVELDRTYALERDTVNAAVAGGRVSPAEALAVRGAIEMAKDRLVEQERMVERYRIALAALIGREAAARPLGAAPDTAKLALPPERLLAELAAHPALRPYNEREALAQADVKLAEASKRPDWAVELLYGQREPYYSNMVTLMFSVELPVFPSGRQDRDVAQRQAQVEQARAALDQARREYDSQVRTYVLDWEVAQSRVERFERAIIPLARERVDAALAAYRGGGATLAMVLEAERALAEANLGRHNALLERGKAWANLNYLLLPEGA
ncbi:MAG: TolC family protein, partial [Burkholderiales bacterium]|nr:TolC family protein [Burkholderiales bacterium]